MDKIISRPLNKPVQKTESDIFEIPKKFISFTGSVSAKEIDFKKMAAKGFELSDTYKFSKNGHSFTSIWSKKQYSPKGESNKMYAVTWNGNIVWQGSFSDKKNKIGLVTLSDEGDSLAFSIENLEDDGKTVKSYKIWFDGIFSQTFLGQPPINILIPSDGKNYGFIRNSNELFKTNSCEIVMGGNFTINSRLLGFTDSAVLLGLSETGFKIRDYNKKIGEVIVDPINSDIFFQSWSDKGKDNEDKQLYTGIRFGREGKDGNGFKKIDDIDEKSITIDGKSYNTKLVAPTLYKAVSKHTLTYSDDLYGRNPF